MSKAAKVLLILGIILLVIGCSQKEYIEKKEEDASKLVSLENKIEDEQAESTVKEDNKYKVQKYTILDMEDTNKVENVKIAINTINNMVLKNGEEFSYNNILGQRTADKGYKPATIIIGNSKGIANGGGICQVSSTIYMACKELNLEILERRPHSSRVDYCSIDDEAMVNWGTSDFRFKNNLNEDITLKLYLAPIEGNDAEQKVVCEIW